MHKKFVLILLLIAFGSQSAFALFGARPMGMGGAFVGIADDANAAYWNPAGIAMNPEVALTGSTMNNNRNTWVGDNVMNLKLCYEMEMNPFEWIAGIGLASVVALESAKYLSDQGIVQKNWGRGGEAPSREQPVTSQVEGTLEVVSLKHQLKETAKKITSDASQKAKETVKAVAKNTTVDVNIGLLPWSPWYHPNYSSPHYWEQPRKDDVTKAQFALGLSWVNDYNIPLDQKTNWYTLTIASGFEERIAVGAGINFYDLTKISTGIRGMGADLDLGVLAKPVEYISVGLATKGILTTDFQWQSGEKTRGYEMRVDGGLAIQPTPNLTIAADVHNILSQNGKTATMHYGAEAVVLPGLLARAGLDNGNKTVGLTLAVGNLTIDYAVLGGTYNRTQMIGGSWRF
ncbi:MAG: hypothetical protein PHH14_06040 [Candidatus Margulisbacteria bacterium]|nr:hypothetical protein [Candidatus Margulisiibacteriota bacterium]